MSIHTTSKIMRSLDDLAQQRLIISSSNNSELNRLLSEQQLVISDVAARTRLEIDSILIAQSEAGQKMLDRQKSQMRDIEYQIRELKKNLAYEEEKLKITNPFRF